MHDGTALAGVQKVISTNATKLHCGEHPVRRFDSPEIMENSTGNIYGMLARRCRVIVRLRLDWRLTEATYILYHVQCIYNFTLRHDRCQPHAPTKLANLFQYMPKRRVRKGHTTVSSKLPERVRCTLLGTFSSDVRFGAL